MKAPKNYYNVVDQKKLGLDQIDKNAAAIAAIEPRILPEATSADEGKVPKVQADGTYALATDEGLPAVTTANNRDVLRVVNGSWTNTNIQSELIASVSGTATISGSSVTGFSLSLNSLYIGNRAGQTWKINAKSGDDVSSFFCSECIQVSEGVYHAEFTNVRNGIIRTITMEGGSVTTGTYTEIKVPITYLDVTISGSSVTLPTGTTYADIYAILNDGVEIKLTDGADVYTINDYDNVDLKAYTFDMSISDLYVKEIQLHSDGTGSYTMMTIAGTT